MIPETIYNMVKYNNVNIIYNIMITTPILTGISGLARAIHFHHGLSTTWLDTERTICGR